MSRLAGDVRFPKTIYSSCDFSVEFRTRSCQLGDLFTDFVLKFTMTWELNYSYVEHADVKGASTRISVSSPTWVL